ncbi:popeye domain-containing protein 2 [Sorex fumeus]|uniref:popeye domain-containing protein 2 n=1 Tax=Sorex fumeus TaxID=62283 RepID=UPI0024ADE8D0|nr:popeye domain-containing protein 2 [Sorex fumeus]
MSDSRGLVGQLLRQGPVCSGWKQDVEGAVYHLANCILLLGFMGGSGVSGCFYVFGFLGTGYLCCVLWGWLDACGLDIVLWSFLLAGACLFQLVYLICGLRKNRLSDEFDRLYRTLYLPLQVPLQAYREIVYCCKEQVLTLAAGQTYAMEGETPIDRLSLLLSGRVRVSQDGQFLHYIFPYQFMDSPEWESLQPSEEGMFQVTLTAETECSYISWPRKSLYVLLRKDRYISRLFAALLGYDISEKLYAVNHKVFAKFAMHFDIRLPSLYRVLGPAAPDTGPEPEPEKENEGPQEPDRVPSPAVLTSAQENTPRVPPPAATVSPTPRSPVWVPRPRSGILSDDSTSLVLEDFAEVSESESFMDYRSDGEYMR